MKLIILLLLISIQSNAQILAFEGKGTYGKCGKTIGLRAIEKKLLKPLKVKYTACPYGEADKLKVDPKYTIVIVHSFGSNGFKYVKRSPYVDYVVSIDSRHADF